MQLIVGFVVAFSGGLVLCGSCCFCCFFLLEFLFDFGGIFDSCFRALNFELFLVAVVVLTFLLCTVPYHLSSLFCSPCHSSSYFSSYSLRRLLLLLLLISPASWAYRIWQVQQTKLQRVAQRAHLEMRKVFHTVPHEFQFILFANERVLLSFKDLKYCSTPV